MKLKNQSYTEKKGKNKREKAVEESTQERVPER